MTIASATPSATIFYTTDGTTPTTSSTLYTAPITVAKSQTVKAIATATNYTSSSVASAAYIINGAVATPTFSPPAGTYGASQTVRISSTTPGASLYYTIDGTTPMTSSTLYTVPITVAKSQTVKAIATATNYTNSSVASAAYVITAATPTFSPAGGTYAASQTVTIASATPSARIYYTTNGTTPTTASTLYTRPITVAKSQTVKAIATATNFPNSSVASAVYTIKAATIKVAPASLPNGTISVLYCAVISANGGTAPYRFSVGNPLSVGSGQLPVGLKLSALTGTTALLCGTPTKKGTSNFSLVATDARGATGSTAYKVVIGSAPGLAVAATTAALAPIDNTIASLPAAAAVYYGTSTPLLQVEGNFYTVLSSGGNSTACNNSACGSIVKISSTGIVTTLYSFDSAPDGAYPLALIYANGKLYGSTIAGGSNSPKCLVAAGCGTVYEMNIDGSGFTVLHSFGSNSTATDGAAPSSLAYANGTLYGTTLFGGSTTATCATSLMLSSQIVNYNGCGTAFSVSLAGQTPRQTTLYTFKLSDGTYPSNLVAVGNKLYGTTVVGGKGNGTVFSLTPATSVAPQVVSVMHAFSGIDGATPSSLTASGNVLYGTTAFGGSKQSGTVFALKGNVFSSLYSFAGGADGETPLGLVAGTNVLYGVTYNGGSNSAGTVFSLPTSGSASDYVLNNSLASATQGGYPFALVLFNNTLYGLANAGGSLDAGTLFSLSP